MKQSIVDLLKCFYDLFNSIKPVLEGLVDLLDLIIRIKTSFASL